MKLITQVKTIPATKVASATGTLVSIPATEIQSIESINAGFKREFVYSEYGAPVLDMEGAIERVIRLRTIDVERVCGYVMITRCWIRDGDVPMFEIEGNFTPHGPYKDTVIDIMENGTLILKPRYIKLPAGPVVSIAAFDVVPEE